MPPQSHTIPRFFANGAGGMHRPNWGLSGLWFCLTIALAVRLATAVGVQAWVDRTPGRLCLIAGDAEGYWALAGNLSRGKGFAIYDPPRYVLRMPGFPALLAAGMQLFGEGVLWHRVMLAAVGTAACGAVYLLGRVLFDHAVGLWACALAAFSPVGVVFSVLLLSETLFALFLVASLWAMAKLSAGGRPTLAKGAVAAAGPSAGPARSLSLSLLAGVLAGAATLVRPTWLLAAPAFALLYAGFFRLRGASLVNACCLLLGTALVLAPWVWRNANVTGRFVATTLWVGPSLYDGLNQRATGASDMSFIEADGMYRAVSEYEADQWYRQRALQFARENPGRALALSAAKLWRFWNPVPNAEQFAQPWARLVVALYFLPLLVLALWGAFRSSAAGWRRLLPAAPILYFSAVHAVFIGSLRYRLPAEYALCVLSAVGLRLLLSRATGFQPQEAAA
jgi:4-amino-4-deoxy-L-arabinose transferase-like glycosyltransferase